MTTYNTGNPVPSIDPKDLVDNAHTIDEYVNSSAHTAETRLGVFRRSLAGIDAAFDSMQAGEFTNRAEAAASSAESEADRAEAAADVAEQVADMGSYLTKADADAALPQPEGTVVRVTNDPDPDNNGYWVSDGVDWIYSGLQPVNRDRFNALTQKVSGQNASFVPAYREDSVSASPDGLMDFVIDVFIEGARAGKDYKIDSFQNQDPVVSPVHDSFTISEYEAGTWDGRRFVLERTQAVLIDRTLDRQMLTVVSAIDPSMTFHFLLAPMRLPPVGQRLRVNSPGDPGYSWKISPTRYSTARDYVDGMSALTKNGTVVYPMISKMKDGIPPVTAPSNDLRRWLLPILDVRVENADPDYYYTVAAMYPPSHSEYPNAWIVEKSLRATFATNVETTRLWTYTRASPPWSSNTGIQTIFLQREEMDEQFYITIDTDRVPTSSYYTGTQPDSEGFTYLVDPSRYSNKPVAAPTPAPTFVMGAGPLLTTKRNDGVTLRWPRNGPFDMSLQLQPNGFNDLFNIRQVSAINRETAEARSIFTVSSELFPPLTIFTLEEGLPKDDLVASGRPASAATGGNHGSTGSAGGLQTAMSEFVRHYVDGKLIVDAELDTMANEYAFETVNLVCAWDTVEVGRYVVRQKFKGVVRQNSIELWCAVTALEHIQLRRDSGFQTITSGYEDILFLNGANRTSRVELADAALLTPGPYATTGQDCFGASVRGDELAGVYTVWIDRDYGMGATPEIGGTAGRFRHGDTGNDKLYSGMIFNSTLDMVPGDTYEWHMGVMWGGRSQDPSIDSGVLGFANGEPTVIYSKLNSSAGYVEANLPLGRSVDGRIIGVNGLLTAQPAGGYMFPIVSKSTSDLLSP